MPSPPEHQLPQDNTPAPATASTARDSIVAAAMDYIRRHACEGINTEDVLDYLADQGMLISRSTLERRFRRAAGRSARAAILNERISRAAILLKTTDHSVATIAELVGAKRPEHFATTFKRATGKLPSQARQQADAAGQ